VEIDGKSTEGIVPDEATERMKGKEGAAVTLTIIHPGKTKREKITLLRERIHVETVLGDHRKPDDTWDFMLDPQAGIGYLRLTAFSRDTASELRTAIQKLKAQKCRALVLDLRFNPGGLLSSAIEVSNLFISHGRIVSTRGRNTPERTWDAHKDGAYEGFPMVVMVNHYSASASEIVSACLQDHSRAVVVGERTWGKGSVQNIIELDNGRSALKLTTASFHRPSGKNIHRFPGARSQDDWGVLPNSGFETPLSDRETEALLADRRERDILRPHQKPDANAAKPLSPEKPAVQANVTKAAGPEQTPSLKRGDDAMAKASGAAKNVTPSGTLPAVDSKPAGGSVPATKKKFVDRQLEVGLKYLRDELARVK
jgi:carboxyl-terminal processing protease